ncbi:hypothetical protein HK096_007728 [Nowakowskiella sp. JEL0078]|nr:hypothetical protein HK096_007728 [Nowakowskiella sp. JEL0078]
MHKQFIILVFICCNCQTLRNIVINTMLLGRCTFVIIILIALVVWTSFIIVQHGHARMIINSSFENILAINPLELRNTKKQSSANRILFIPEPCKITTDSNTVSKKSSFASIQQYELVDKQLEWQKWIQHTFPQQTIPYPPKFRGRGIVFTALKSEMWLLLTSITLLRKSGCKLPIEVWQNDGELNSTHLSAFEGLSQMWGGTIRMRVADDFENIVPMEKGVDTSEAGLLEGFKERRLSTKLTAIMNSLFREVLVLDVDVMAVRDPEYLFNSLEFKEDGAIFWPDFWKTASFNPLWGWMGMSCFDEWEQDSGIILLDKAKSWKALQLSVMLNQNNEIGKWRFRLFGDKDVLRFAWRATDTRFMFVQKWVLPAGTLKPIPSIPFCGNSMIQHDLNGNILFIHTNFRSLVWDHFNSKKLPLVYIQLYQKNTSLDSIKPGPINDSFLSFGGTGGYKARNLYLKKLKQRCTNLIEGESNLSRKTSVLLLEDPNIPGAPKKGFSLELFTMLDHFRRIFYPYDANWEVVRESTKRNRTKLGSAKGFTGVSEYYLLEDAISNTTMKNLV